MAILQVWVPTHGMKPIQHVETATATHGMGSLLFFFMSAC